MRRTKQEESFKKAHQGIGKEHEPELMGNLTDLQEFKQRVIDIADLETIESLITKIKGQTNTTDSINLYKPTQ